MALNRWRPVVLFIISAASSSSDDQSCVMRWCKSSLVSFLFLRVREGRERERHSQFFSGRHRSIFLPLPTRVVTLVRGGGGNVWAVLKNYSHCFPVAWSWHIRTTGWFVACFRPVIHFIFLCREDRSFAWNFMGVKFQTYSLFHFCTGGKNSRRSLISQQLVSLRQQEGTIWQKSVPSL